MAVDLRDGLLDLDLHRGLLRRLQLQLLQLSLDLSLDLSLELRLELRRELVLLHEAEAARRGRERGREALHGGLGLLGRGLRDDELDRRVVRGRRRRAA